MLSIMNVTLTKTPIALNIEFTFLTIAMDLLSHFSRHNMANKYK